MRQVNDTGSIITPILNIVQAGALKIPSAELKAKPMKPLIRAPTAPAGSTARSGYFLTIVNVSARPNAVKPPYNAPKIIDPVG